MDDANGQTTLLRELLSDLDGERVRECVRRGEHSLTLTHSLAHLPAGLGALLEGSLELSPLYLGEDGSWSLGGLPASIEWLEGIEDRGRH